MVTILIQAASPVTTIILTEQAVVYVTSATRIRRTLRPIYKAPFITYVLTATLPNELKVKTRVHNGSAQAATSRIPWWTEATPHLLGFMPQETAFELS
jgi:hypothetical protein